MGWRSDSVLRMAHAFLVGFAAVFSSSGCFPNKADLCLFLEVIATDHCPFFLQRPSLFRRLMGVVKNSTNHSMQSLNSEHESEMDANDGGFRSVSNPACPLHARDANSAPSSPQHRQSPRRQGKVPEVLQLQEEEERRQKWAAHRKPGRSASEASCLEMNAHCTSCTLHFMTRFLSFHQLKQRKQIPYSPYIYVNSSYESDDAQVRNQVEL